MAIYNTKKRQRHTPKHAAGLAKDERNAFYNCH